MMGTTTAPVSPQAIPLSDAARISSSSNDSTLKKSEDLGSTLGALHPRMRFKEQAKRQCEEGSPDVVSSSKSQHLNPEKVPGRAQDKSASSPHTTPRPKAHPETSLARPASLKKLSRMADSPGVSEADVSLGSRGLRNTASLDELSSKSSTQGGAKQIKEKKHKHVHHFRSVPIPTTASDSTTTSTNNSGTSNSKGKRSFETVHNFQPEVKKRRPGRPRKNPTPATPHWELTAAKSAAELEQEERDRDESEKQAKAAEDAKASDEDDDAAMARKLHRQMNCTPVRTTRTRTPLPSKGPDHDPVHLNDPGILPSC
mmetsp:Transcript_27414/g.52208  ORF Transcript_27414/g.52208 Transcript_27414/m.52208 type:complete len:314 (+) Transcript_27414:392-1333(+)